MQDLRCLSLYPPFPRGAGCGSDRRQVLPVAVSGVRPHQRNSRCAKLLSPVGPNSSHTASRARLQPNAEGEPTVDARALAPYPLLQCDAGGDRSEDDQRRQPLRLDSAPTSAAGLRGHRSVVLSRRLSRSPTAGPVRTWPSLATAGRVQGRPGLLWRRQMVSYL